jgi:hypothetical protein
LLRDSVMIVVSEPATGGDLLDGAIERGVKMAEEAALKIMFAQRLAAERMQVAIRIDATTAAWVRGALPITRIDDIEYLETDAHG